MSGRDELLKQIRIMGRGTRGAPPAILELPDSALYEMFLQMQRGMSNRSIARHLQKQGMSGSENSLQQSVSLLRKRIAPLLDREAPVQSLPQTALKLPPEVSFLPPDQMLSTVTDIVNNYGESIRQLTEAAAESGTPITEDLSKHAKAYAALVATKTRLEQSVMKSRPVDLQEDLVSQERADRVWNYLTDNGRDTHKMAKAADKFIALLEAKCIALEQDATGEWREAAVKRPGRSEHR
jgi:hypothetical protein